MYNLLEKIILYILLGAIYIYYLKYIFITLKFQNGFVFCVF